MPRIVLHVGMPKTATTTLQESCARSRSWLRSRDVLYPRLRLGAPFKPFSINHRLLTERWLAPPTSPSFGEGRSYWRRSVVPQLEAARAGSVLLSSEGLWNLCPDRDAERRFEIMRDCFRGFDVRVLVYLRRQDCYLEAMHNQRVKNSVETRSLREYVSASLRDGHADLFAKLTMWREQFGAENLRVRVFEPEQLEGESIVTDFFAQLGIADLTGLARIEPRNPQRRSELMRLQMSLNPYLKQHGHRRAAKHAFDWLQKVIPGRGARTMPYSLAIEIMEHFAAGNRRVAREILGRDDGRLFRRLPTDETPWEHVEPAPFRRS